MNIRGSMKTKYRLEVNKGFLKNFLTNYRLFKYNDDQTIFYEIVKTNSKINLYMHLDLLGIRDKMKFNRFYRIGYSKNGKIVFAEFIFT